MRDNAKAVIIPIFVSMVIMVIGFFLSQWLDIGFKKEVKLLEAKIENNNLLYFKLRFKKENLKDFGFYFEVDENIDTCYAEIVSPIKKIPSDSFKIKGRHVDFSHRKNLDYNQEVKFFIKFDVERFKLPSEGLKLNLLNVKNERIYILKAKGFSYYLTIVFIGLLGVLMLLFLFYHKFRNGKWKKFINLLTDYRNSIYRLKNKGRSFLEFTMNSIISGKTKSNPIYEDIIDNLIDKEMFITKYIEPASPLDDKSKKVWFAKKIHNEGIYIRIRNKCIRNFLINIISKKRRTKANELYELKNEMKKESMKLKNIISSKKK